MSTPMPSTPAFWQRNQIVGVAAAQVGDALELELPGQIDHVRPRAPLPDDRRPDRDPPDIAVHVLAEPALSGQQVAEHVHGLAVVTGQPHEIAAVVVDRTAEVGEPAAVAIRPDDVPLGQVADSCFGQELVGAALRGTEAVGGQFGEDTEGFERGEDGADRVTPHVVEDRNSVTDPAHR
jgi:hypothetical protein